ncbi:MAG: metallophosphoesterase family protein [Deltaproteobacteria bacterium]|nr:metallophosphoesterase family protein [Deltaproteobacteria bacterium]
MRYGIISDIHGNIEALEQSLAALKKESIDQYVSLGDVVGYGANPEECSQIVRELCEVSILGNHDAAVCGRMDYSYYYDAARNALDWCREQVSEQTTEWLKERPYNVRVDNVEFCHGSPICPEEFEYIFTREKAKELIPHRESLARVTFIGHSHLTRSFAVGEEEAYNVRGPAFTLRDEYRYVITAGSVGQPRDYDPRSCCCVYDSETQEFRYIRSEYDIDKQMNKIVAAGLAYNFGARLLVGI